MALVSSKVGWVMRHGMHFYKLGRTSEHRKAMCRNMAQNLIEHGSMTTTVAKAKNLRPYFEKLVTLAIKARRAAASGDKAGALQARRLIHSLISDRAIIPEAHQEAYEGMSDAARSKTRRMGSGRRHRTGDPKGRLAFTTESVTHRLIENIAPQFENRKGGYTRLIPLPTWRVGDGSMLAVIQLVGKEEAPTSLAKPKRSARDRRTEARYGYAAKLAKGWGAAKS